MDEKKGIMEIYPYNLTADLGIDPAKVNPFWLMQTVTNTLTEREVEVVH